MRRTAVALLDALGFRGIWDRHAAEGVLDKLKYLASEANEAVEGPLGSLDYLFDVDKQIRFLSDTVVLSCAVQTSQAADSRSFNPDERDHLPTFSDFLAVWYVCEIAARFVSAGIAEGEPPLAYRGAIAFNEFEIRDQFMIGPAIDEAAQSERLAEAALVWLCPSAVDIVEDAKVRFTNSRLQEPFLGLTNEFAILSDYSVPLKAGGSFRTHVLNPLFRVPGSLGGWKARCLSTFASSDIRVQIKKQNTETFLFQCELDVANRFRR